MKIKILLVTILFSCFSWGQLLQWNTFGNIGTETTEPSTTNNPNISPSNLTQGSITALANVNRFGGSGWFNTGNTGSGNIIAEAIAGNDYIQFIVTPNSGFSFTPTSFVFNWENSGTGPKKVVLRSSVDSYANNLGLVDPVAAIATQNTITITGLSNLATATTFRIYGYGANNILGTGGFDIGTNTVNVILNGTTAPISTITTNTLIAGNPFCVSATTGIAVSVPFAIAGVYDAGNVFTAQLSDASGSFASPVNIGTLSASTSGTISATIPAGTITGTGYRIRVVSSNPVVTGSNNTVDLAVNLTSVSVAPSATQNIAVATNGTTLTVSESPGATSRQWYYSNDNGGPYTTLIASATATTYVPNFLTNGSYYVVCTTISPCGTITSNQVQINAAVPVSQINVKAVISSNPSISNGSKITSSLNNTLFASVLVGSNQAKVFRIENKGTVTLEISSITFGGANPGDFAASPNTLSIAAGSFQDFTVTFSPTAIGARTTTISINSNDEFNTPYVFDLKGTGKIAPLIDINLVGNLVGIPDNSLFPSALNFTAFGVVTIGSATPSITRSFIIQNLGTNSLALTGTPIVTISGANAGSFSISPQPTSGTIAGAGSLTFDVIFAPSTLGSKNATINILSNDSDEALYNFNINGIGKTTASNVYVTGNNNTVQKGATSTSISNNTNFGGLLIPSGVKQNTFVITNLSAGPIQFNNVTITGADAASFSVVANPSATVVLTGESTTMTINFAPTTVGPKIAVATFTSNDSVDGTFSFAISGYGESYTPCGLKVPTIIAIQDFEDIPESPTWLYDYVTTNGTVNVAGNNFALPTPTNGFIGAKAFQFKAATNAIATTVITLDEIDTSRFANIYMSMKVAALRTGSQGLDIGDYIQIETSVDSGLNWSKEAKLSGFNDSRWSFAATGVFDAIYTGTNNSASLDSRMGNADLAAGIATINLKSLPASTNLLIRITMVNNDTDEIWAIDNIKIEEQSPEITFWEGISWSGGPPTPSTKVIIKEDYNTGLHGNINACECQVNPGKTLTIDTGGFALPDPYVEIQGNIFNEGIINIKNNASLIQINNSATNAGSGVTNVTRDTTPYQKYDYTYWSSPIQNNTIGSSFSTWRQNYTFEYDTTKFLDLFSGLGNQTTGSPDTFDDNGDDWVPVTQATTMVPGRGYAIMENQASHPATTSVLFSGAPNNGLVTAALKFSANTTDTTDDMNFVGNPYPSAISANDFINANLPNISGTLFFWTHKDDVNTTNPGPDLYNFTNDDYAYYNLSGGLATNATTGTASDSGSNAPSGFIASGQGFFVEAQNEVDLIFSNTMRSKIYNNSNFWRSANQNQKDRLWLNLTNTDGMFSQQLIGYFDNATLENDQAYDAQMLKGPSNINFYSQSQNQFYKIQARPTFNSSDTVPLGFTTTANSDFTIAIDNKEGVFDTQNIYLQDNLLNIIHDLKQAPYNFASTYGTFDERFVLRYENSILSNNTFVNAENQVSIATKDSKINIVSNTQNIKQIEVFDILGRKIFNNNQVNDKTFTTTNFLAKNQTLIVKIKLENDEIVTRKIII